MNFKWAVFLCVLALFLSFLTAGICDVQDLQDTYETAMKKSKTQPRPAPSLHMKEPPVLVEFGVKDTVSFFVTSPVGADIVQDEWQTWNEWNEWDEWDEWEEWDEWKEWE